MSDRRRVLAALGGLATVGSWVLAGCGFELRRAPKLHFVSIALQGFEPRSPLAEALRRQLVLQVHVLEAPDRADVILRALADRRDKSVVASTAAAQVTEFTLRLNFSFRAATPGGRELIPKTELMLSRDMSYSETFALAKEQEEAALYEDMQSDVVLQVLRRLAAITL